MKPKLLYNGARPLCVLCEDDEELSDLERELNGYAQSNQTVRHAAAIRIIMQRFARGERLPSQMFHKAGETHDIQVYEFIKQPIRVSDSCLLRRYPELKRLSFAQPQCAEKMAEDQEIRFGKGLSSTAKYAVIGV